VAVYERTYRSYAGTLTDERTRFLVLPRYAYEEVFRSKLFVSFLVACYIWPLVLSVLIYLPHNLSFLKFIQAEAGSILAIFKYDGGFFFRWFMIPYFFVSFLVALIVGPALISADLRNNGLPLYLARPFSRTEYLLGKSAVLIILLSAVTWIPGFLLFLFQSYMAGLDWFREHYRIGIAILLSSWIWILVLCLLSLSLSAYVKWKPIARAAMIGVFFVLSALGATLNVLLDTHWGDLINVSTMMGVVSSSLFGLTLPGNVPPAAAWLSLLTMCGCFLILLARKVKAYEVVRS
jgi:ABC-2 type transport system permease protein